MFLLNTEFNFDVFFEFLVLIGIFCYNLFSFMSPDPDSDQNQSQNVLVCYFSPVQLLLKIS